MGRAQREMEDTARDKCAIYVYYFHSVGGGKKCTFGIERREKIPEYFSSSNRRKDCEAQRKKYLGYVRGSYVCIFIRVYIYMHICIHFEILWNDGLVSSMKVTETSRSDLYSVWPGHCWTDPTIFPRLSRFSFSLSRVFQQRQKERSPAHVSRILYIHVHPHTLQNTCVHRVTESFKIRFSKLSVRFFILRQIGKLVYN